MPSAIEKLRSRLQATESAVGELTTDVDAVRARIAALKSERRQTAEAPRPLAEAQASLDARLASEAETFRAERLRPFVASLAAGGQTLLLGGHWQPMHGGNLYQALAGLFPALLHETLAKELERHYQTVEAGLPRPEREARLAAIDRELFTLEVTEETLITAAESAGLQVLRRGDADCAAVLGLPLEVAA